MILMAETEENWSSNQLLENSISLQMGAISNVAFGLILFKCFSQLCDNI